MPEVVVGYHVNKLSSAILPCKSITPRFPIVQNILADPASISIGKQDNSWTIDSCKIPGAQNSAPYHLQIALSVLG